MSHHFWGLMMWSVLLGAIPLDIKLSILCRFTISICMHPPHHTVFPLLNFAELNWGKCFWKVSFEAFKSIITMLTQISFTAPQKNSMKFNSQWNLGRKIHKYPASSMTSWTLDFCARKSGCFTRIVQAQQSVEHCFGFWHSNQRPVLQSPHSWGTSFTPFGFPGAVGWSAGRIIGWEMHSPLHINHPSCIIGWAPPEFRFILCTKRASFGYVAWPYELSTIIRAW